MNKRLKPVLALILTMFMSVSTLSNTYTVSAEGEETVTTEQTTTEDVNEQEEVEDNNVNEEDSSNVEEVTPEEDTSEDVANEEQDAVEEKIGDASMMEYFLVDSPVVDNSVTENFVLSLNNTEGYSDFSITVKKSDGSTFDLESNEQVDNLIKFSRVFSAEEKGEYLVTLLHYSLNGEKYYLNFSDLGMNVKFGVDQEYTGYDETLPDMTEDITEEEEELNNSIIQVTDVNNASEEVAEGMMAQDFPAAMALIDEDIDTQSNEGITLCLDPGHGGAESGTLNYNGTGLEKDYNLKIAKYCYDELQKYNCKVVMTRSTDKYMTLEERAEYAKQQGAQYLISFHLNASVSHKAYGAEVYYPNTNWRPDISEKGKVMAQAIQNQLVSLGLHDRGIKFRTIDINEYPNPHRYDDNSIADYYGVIRNAKTRGITGLIIEHCCMDNESDFNKYLGSEEKIKQLGVADANGIVAALGLTKAVANTNPSVTYQTHVQDYGWQEWKNDGEMSGTSGQSKRLEGINIKLQNLSGSVEYQTHVQDIGWQGWKSNGAMAGTSGQSKRLEAIKIKLSGDAANKYDIYYRVHAQDYGWLGWAKNGESAGSEGYSKRLEGIEIKLVKKGGAAPGSTSRPFVCKTITYQTHVQNIGWQAEKADGEVSGTSGRSLRLEAIKIKLGASIDGGVSYRTHVQDYGWQSFVQNGQLSGTSGKSKRLEAIQIKLTGNAANQYDIYYRVHAQNFGWLGWAKNGESAGTEGYSKRLEAIEIKLVKKGASVPGSTSRPFVCKSISYQTHVQNIGWQAQKADGEVSGTSGKALRLEAIKIKLGDSIDGGITYATHVQDIGWQSFVQNGQLSGTSGKAKRLEAIQINLTGNAANQYDVYYRVHAQHFGWLGWAKNGQSAGTAGYSYRLEGIQIVLVPKGGSAPGSTINHYYNKGHAADDESTVLTKPNTNTSKPSTNNTASDKTPIMGASQTSVAQMVRYYNSKSSGYDTFTGENKKYNGSLAKGGASTIEQFAQIVYEEARAEGVRAEVVFAQCMLETGFLKYGGDVLPNQYNFAGIGATGAVHGASFENVRVGVRAHVQHLKAYASLDGLTKQCVDPRFNLVARGCAQYVEWLGMKENPKGYGWASAKNYGPNIVNMVRNLLSK